MNKEQVKELSDAIKQARNVSEVFAVILDMNLGLDVRGSMNLLKNYEAGHLEAFLCGCQIYHRTHDHALSSPNFIHPPEDYIIKPAKKLNWEKVMKHGGYGLEFEFSDGDDWEVGTLIGYDVADVDNEPFFSNSYGNVRWCNQCRLIEGVNYPDEEWYE